MDHRGLWGAAPPRASMDTSPTPWSTCGLSPSNELPRHWAVWEGDW